MADPRLPDWQLFKRLGRYSKGAPRAVICFKWQRRSEDISTYLDSDWAGDRPNTKSTSGGRLQGNRRSLLGRQRQEPRSRTAQGRLEGRGREAEGTDA